MSDQHPGNTWNTLYRLGAVAAGIAVVLYAAALVMVTVTATPPTEGGAATLEYVHAHRAA